MKPKLTQSDFDDLLKASGLYQGQPLHIAGAEIQGDKVVFVFCGNTNTGEYGQWEFELIKGAKLNIQQNY